MAAWCAGGGARGWQFLKRNRESQDAFEARVAEAPVAALSTRERFRTPMVAVASQRDRMEAARRDMANDGGTPDGTIGLEVSVRGH